MSKRKFCFLQVSDNLLNPDDLTNPADVYFKAIWNHLDGEGYFKPPHSWEVPLWIAELSYCLDDRLHEKQLFHIDEICDDFCIFDKPHHPQLPDADIYLGSIMDCNKEYFRIVARNNPNKEFRFGGYIGYVKFSEYFEGLDNVNWYSDIEDFCASMKIEYRYGTDYSLFKGMKCIPRLVLSNGCTNHCRFCTVPDEIIEIEPEEIYEQIQSMKNLDFELVYINDKTFGQTNNYIALRYVYNAIKRFNPKFRGFIVQTTCLQVFHFDKQHIDLKDLHIVNVELGIESYNDEILRKYRKPQSITLIDKTIDILEKTGVNIIPNIIIGLPGETWNTYALTHRWLNENKHKFLMLNVTNFVPYVGSDDISIIKKDFNENSTNRSYHTKEEMKATKMFSDEIFKIGMEILKNTKAGSV